MARTGHAQGLRRRAAAARLAVAAALLSAGAAAIHAAAAGPHLDHYVPFGVLFAATALLQVAWAVGVLVVPSPRVLVAGAVGNAGVVAAWALSRTAGLPVGPEPWTAEPLTALDGTATAFELGIVAAIAVLLLARVPDPVPFEARRTAAIGAVAVAALTAVPLAVAGGDHHHEGDHHAGLAHHEAAHAHTAAARPRSSAPPRAERLRSARPKPHGTARPRRPAGSHDHASHPHTHHP